MINQLSSTIGAKEMEIAEAQAQLTSTREELNIALEILKTPIQIDNQEDAK